MSLLKTGQCFTNELGLPANKNVIAATFLDCNGDALVPNTQLATCADIPVVVPQALTLAGQTLTLSGGGGSVTLPDSDDQTLTLVGNALSISGGNTVTLPSAPGQVAQVLSITGNTVSLSGGGGSVTVPDSDDQQLSIAGNVISLTDGGSVTLPAAAAPALSIAGQNLSISGGNTVVLPTATAITEGAGTEVSGTGTVADPYIIDVASIAGNFTFPDSATYATVGQVESFSAAFTNTSTKPVKGLVFATWNGAYTQSGSVAGSTYNLNQSFKVDGVQDNALSSVLWGGNTGGYDISILSKGPGAATTMEDSTFGTTIKAITVAPGATVNVTVDVRLNLLAGAASVGSTYTTQSRQIAFLGVGV